MISKILVPHDGTEMSDRALEQATELAKAFKAQLILIHVIEQIPISPSIMLGSDLVLINRARRNVRKELEEGWNKMAEVKIHELKMSNLEATCDCLVGSAAEKILQFGKLKKSISS